MSCTECDIEQKKPRKLSVLGGGNSTNVTNTEQNVTEIREPKSIFYTYSLICPVEGETTPYLSTTGKWVSLISNIFCFESLACN